MKTTLEEGLDFLRGGFKGMPRGQNQCSLRCEKHEGTKQFVTRKGSKDSTI